MSVYLNDGEYKEMTAGCQLKSGFRGSEFRVEKNQTARIKAIVPSSGYKSVLPNGVWRENDLKLEMN